MKRVFVGLMLVAGLCLAVQADDRSADGPISASALADLQKFRETQTREMDALKVRVTQHEAKTAQVEADVGRQLSELEARIDAKIGGLAETMSGVTDKLNENIAALSAAAPKESPTQIPPEIYQAVEKLSEKPSQASGRMVTIDGVQHDLHKYIQDNYVQDVEVRPASFMDAHLIEHGVRPADFASLDYRTKLMLHSAIHTVEDRGKKPVAAVVTQKTSAPSPMASVAYSGAYRSYSNCPNGNCASSSGGFFKTLLGGRRSRRGK